MQALVQSGYFAALAQYGVEAVTYAGSVEPAPACGSMAPSRLERLAIAQFVDCQVTNGQKPGNVVNMFLPPSTIRNAARPAYLCGDDPRYRNLYAYHGSTEGAAAVPFTVVPSLCAINFTRILRRTIVNGTLGFLTIGLTHEIVEALTNLFGSGWIDAGKGANAGEIADICEPAPYATFRTQPIPFSRGALTAYWSNQDNRCVFGKAR
ncbi:MAG TPA: hypothetical protein VGZ23_11750 [bacterium]|nr:hypothetical protein [bacterium]